MYGFQAVNVEAQLRTPTSLLRWQRRFISLRKEHPVFGLGTYELLEPSNPRIFAHLRVYEDDVMLRNNLARSAQAVELDLSAYQGRVPVEVFGRLALPAIGELPYLLTLAPRGFYWFQLTEDDSGDDLSILDDERFGVDFVEQRRFGLKAREVAYIEISECVALREEPPQLALALVEARFGEGTHETYQVPLGLRPADEGWSERVIAEAGSLTIYDALADPACGRRTASPGCAAAPRRPRRRARCVSAGRRRRQQGSAGLSMRGRSASSSRTRRSCSARR